MLNLKEIKVRYDATSIAPWVASIEGRDHESGSHFIMTGIPKGEDIWQEKRGEDLEIHGATIARLRFYSTCKARYPSIGSRNRKIKWLTKKQISHA